MHLSWSLYIIAKSDNSCLHNCSSICPSGWNAFDWTRLHVIYFDVSCSKQLLKLPTGFLYYLSIKEIWIILLTHWNKWMIYESLTGWNFIKCDNGIRFMNFTRIFEFHYNVTKIIVRLTLLEDFRTLTVMCRSFILQWDFFRQIQRINFMFNNFSTFVPYIREHETNCYRQTGHTCQRNTAQLFC